LRIVGSRSSPDTRRLREFAVRNRLPHASVDLETDPAAALSRDPYLLETTLPGVFAAGDVRSGSVKRVTSAVGEGSIAVRFVSEHLGRRSGLAATGPTAR